ncbi:acetate kinase [Candidatus Peregrinibacteria bacterium]|nr:acetate kinase [Candidatus Peregrinibacteria bacterium]
MKILVVNTGSSSLKFQLIDAKKNFTELYSGIVDNIGKKNCFFDAKINHTRIHFKKNISNHEKGLQEALKIMLKNKAVKSLKEIKAVGHRVVHGGEKYKNAVKITSQVKKTIKELYELAPLHNPANLQGILACEKLLKNIPNIAVFDTSFHQTMPQKAYLYAIPKEYYKKFKIRRYGFHGTSHKYISQETYKLLKNKKAKIITCHLGNGSSISAVSGGKSIDTSMGFTPLEGVIMGTRSGTIDPAIILYLLKKHKLSPEKIDEILNYRSGILAVSEISSDVRDIWAAAQRKNKKAIFALEYMAYSIAKQIGAYIAAMNGIDAITFTAGIGENAWYLRKDICEYLNFIGVKLDTAKNRASKPLISSPLSKVKVFVMPSNEGLEIAEEVINMIK